MTQVKEQRRLTLTETEPPYHLTLDDKLLATEAIVMKRDGQPLVALVPLNEYTLFQSWRESAKQQAEETALEQEHVAFERMLPELLSHYQGSFVAILNGQLVGVGDDKLVVWKEARQQHNNASVYVQLVEAPSRVYKTSYRKVVSR